jgi:glucose 1-dehydrogenase
MRAITVEPKKSGSAKWEEVQEPDVREGSVLVETIAVGVCGTDVEIIEGKYGWAPSGKTRLILGHESLGRVLEPDPAGRLKKGDLVVGIVRRPDPVPCPNCAVGEWDMCRNGQYTERGIKQIDGFMSERWRIEPEYAMKVDSSLGLLGVLLEPTTVVTKAWEHVDSIGRRAFWDPRTVLVTGAGPIGLLPAMLGVQRDWTFMFLIELIPVSSLTWCALWAPHTIPAVSPASDSSRILSSNAPRGAGHIRVHTASRDRRHHLSYWHWKR